MSYQHRMQELVLKSGCSWASEVKAPPPCSREASAGGGIGIGTPRADECFLPKGPFSGLTICVTGLSKEARKQVQITTERLGGSYSPDLHSGCTHLVVQRSAGRKYEHALKNRFKKGLFVVTLAWFVNSARLNERLDESKYDATTGDVESAENSLPRDDPAACMPQKPSFSAPLPPLTNKPLASLQVVPMASNNKNSTELPKAPRKPMFSGICFYIDNDISTELQIKVVEAAVKEGATCISDWYIGCNATHIVCEDNALVKYVGYKIHLVSPMWVLRTVKEHAWYHLVHISLDLLRHFPHLLDKKSEPAAAQQQQQQHGSSRKMLALCAREDSQTRQLKLDTSEARVRAARESIRRRRGPSMQPCRALPRPITPQSMMESICWSVSEPPSTAQLYLDSSDGTGHYDQASDYFDAQESGKDSSSGEVYVRPLNDSEKQDVVYKGAFLTILFPLDRFSEMGPSSKPFFSEKGFTRQQILENVYGFYQEPLSSSEIEVAVYTDSKHAERLRAVYSAPETVEAGYVPTKRYEFLGSRRNFEGLRRLSVEKNGQVYQLCLGS
ncbi:uncharacterized protein LOC112341415 [Selaginella moellendorffii]|uniref:uncharacterized protein LOC112341415 n=1 Tax=Selaginella moellendorffii TaxID=88036 RepID=UPI000D1CEC1B|nr:uncharacterized protein LOC112341415 [Selaginella moellendorffii]|eukprot:XP_024517233.1 uncharacterized protein LOC112341415 [Selaginella moellendorffii]